MPGSDRLTCVVAGAGLGGLTAAIALRRSGHRVTVLEQADRLGAVGAGIQLAPNAARLLAELGVVELLRDTAVAAEAAVRRRWEDGSVIGRVTLGETLLRRFGSPYLCAHRADVHAALVTAATGPAGAGPPVEILLGRGVSTVAATGPGQARVVTVDGSEFAADVVIGADGIRSVVRETLHGGSPSTSFSGQVTHRHIVDVATLGEDALIAEIVDHPAQNIWLGPGRHAITHPISGGTALYLGVTVEGSPDDEAFWSAAGDRARLLDEMRGWDPRLLRMIEAAPASTAYGLHDSEPLERWVEGRVCLLGDACHAMLPFQAQGAAQAVEDAAVLASVLDGADASDVPAALERYAALRRPRTARVQRASRDNGGAFHLPDGPEQRERDARLRDGSGDFASYEWLWAVGAHAAPAAA